jgi:hypothetical protein
VQSRPGVFATMIVGRNVIGAILEHTSKLPGRKPGFQSL